MKINPAAWADATPYSKGERGVVEPRVWELRTGPVRLIVHRLHGYDGWLWFGSCHELKIDRVILAATVVTEAQSELMTLALDKARGYVQALELLDQAFSLQDARVLSRGTMDSSLMLRYLGTLAGEYLQTVIHSEMRIGVGWGSTLWETVNSLQPKKYTGVDVVGIIGAVEP